MHHINFGQTKMHAQPFIGSRFLTQSEALSGPIFGMFEQTVTVKDLASSPI